MNSMHLSRISLVWAIVFALFYALLAAGLVFPLEHPIFGTDLYNAYYLRFSEGRFDLPMRMLQFEGHYRADGTGILYHGIAPLLTRAALSPFVALHVFPTAAFSIWLWAVVGTAFYHLAIIQVVTKYTPPLQGVPALAIATLIGCGIWICSPGLLLAANTVLYHEPISIAYAAMAIAVFLMVRCLVFSMPLRRAIPPIALMATVALHSRPHLAVGLYVGLACLMLLSLVQERRRAVPSLVLGTAILVGGALIFLQLNTARFGSSTDMHGEIGAQEDTQSVQYGPVFFGTDYAESGRGKAFRDHGRFHPWRVLPNMIVYSFDYPDVGETLAAVHRQITEPVSGYGHIEAPRFGMLTLWPVWMVLAAVGLTKARPRVAGGLRATPILLATGIAALLMLSYPTVAFRYRFDLWPLLMATILVTLPGLLQKLPAEGLAQTRVYTLGTAFLVPGVLATGLAIVPYAHSYQTVPGRNYENWDEAKCRAMIENKPFEETRIAEICVDPMSVFQTEAQG